METAKMRRALGGRLALVMGLAWLAVPARAQVVEYYHTDAIGNVRAVTNQAQQVVGRHDYLPYGEEWCPGPPAGVCGAVTPGQAKRFTGKERDPETGLDYFGARYYGSRIGRFTTVDPVYTWQENLVDPQRWNRYAYARNNPLRYVDPDGREVVAVMGGRMYGMGTEGGPAMSRQEAAVAGLLYGGAFAAAFGAAIAPLAPAAAIEAQIATGACGASAGCQNAVRGMAEAVSGAPPGAAGVVPTFRLGHTFSKHGAAMTEQISREAQATGRSVGQWLDEAAARKLIGEHLGELKNGAKTIDIPEGIGRIIRPDGSSVAATKARLVPSGSGVKSAFPTE